MDEAGRLFLNGPYDAFITVTDVHDANAAREVDVLVAFGIDQAGSGRRVGRDLTGKLPNGARHDCVAPRDQLVIVSHFRSGDWLVRKDGPDVKITTPHVSTRGSDPSA
jgi:hypothetical protein